MELTPEDKLIMCEINKVKDELNDIAERHNLKMDFRIKWDYAD